MNKTAITPATRGTRTQTRPAAKPSTLFSRLWEAVHPKPAPPIGHPIPRLSVPSVPTAGNVQGSKARRPAVLDRLDALLMTWLTLALLATGCVGPRPLKGGKAVTTRRPAGIIEQTLSQGENPFQASKQSQESVKARTYTVPAGSRIEQAPTPGAETARAASPAAASCQPASAIILSAPMPVVEREEVRARTELGAAQKDTARELGARLTSLKGIVWIGAGLFVFGLASLVWPPLKAIIASVTTSAALTLGGLALMVLPTLIVGHELLILGGVAVAVGGWFLAHRHGCLRGMAAASTADPTPTNSLGRS